MPQDGQNVAILIGITEDEADEILKMLEEIQAHDEGLYPLIEAAANKFDDKKAMFVGWVLGHMVARMHFEQRIMGLMAEN